MRVFGSVSSCWPGPHNADLFNPAEERGCSTELASFCGLWPDSFFPFFPFFTGFYYSFLIALIG